jgi:plastocyanin
MRTSIFVLASLLGIGSTATAGEITGTITVGKPLTKPRAELAPYQARGIFVAAGGANKAAGEELSRIVIYLEGEGLPGAEPIHAELGQKKRQFTEEVLVVPVGSTVAFPNGDPIFHNVFSLSKAKQFDLGYYPMNQSRSVKLDKPGVIQVYCHIHREMSAAVMVVQSPWYGRPEENGHFSLTGIPAGVYQLVVWHKSAGFFRRRVVIPAEGSVDLNMDVPVSVAEARVEQSAGGLRGQDANH